MTRSLLERHRTGMITDDHLVVECLDMIDPEDPGLVLSSLPDDVLVRMLQFADECLRGRMVADYAALPPQNKVVAARRWIENWRLQEATTMA